MTHSPLALSHFVFRQLQRGADGSQRARPELQPEQVEGRMWRKKLVDK